MESIKIEIDCILREEIELARKDDPALIVRSAFDVIEDYLNQGMSLERIAAALQKHDFKITKGHLVRHLGIVREERGLEPLKRGRKRTPGAAAVLRSTEPTPSSSVERLPVGPALVPAPAPVANCAPLVLEKPKTMDEYRANQEKIKVEARQIIASQASQKNVPLEINQLKFINVKGKGVLDVTQMNISDFLTVSKTIPKNTPIPDELLMTVVAENRIRDLYEQTLEKYSKAVVEWNLNQLKGKS